jgi:sigma-B regulation protein RsbU (phosphoserine phosphatase)
MGPIFMALGSIVVRDVGAESSTWLAYNLRSIWEFFFPCLLIFSWLFPYDRLGRTRLGWMRLAIFLPQIMHIIIVLFAANMIGLLDAFEVNPNDQGFGRFVLIPMAKLFSGLKILIGGIRAYDKLIFGMINMAYALAAMWFLETGARLVSNPRILTQTRWVLWGTRLGLGIFLIAQGGALFFPRSMPADVYSALLVIALLTGSTLFILATIRHQFLDVQMAFRQSFVNTVTSAVLVGLYVLIVVQAREMLAPMFGERAEIVSYGFIIVMLLMFQPINNWLDNLVRSMFIHTRTDHRNVLERFSRQVISQFNPDQLRKIIKETLQTALLVDEVYFVQYDDEMEDYAVLPSEDYPRRFLVERSDLLLRGINLLEGPTYYHSLTDFREGSDLAAILEGRGVRMIMPLKDAEHLLGFVALTGKAAGYSYSSEDMNLLGVLSNQSVTALTNARLYVESIERLRLQEEMNMARQIQVDLLPSSPPQLPCTLICAQSTPSRTVGGDFYDFLLLSDDRLGLVIADASGKGMPAALMIAQTQAIIRSEVTNGNPISAVLRNTNQQVATATSSEKYVTLFYGELDTKRGLLRYANAGHNYPILVHADGEVELLKVGGPIIGAFPAMEYESSSVSLETDDVLFLFTDGLSEAMDENDTEFGEERILRLVSEHRRQEPSRIIDLILEEVRKHDPTYPPRDDTTVIAIKMHNGDPIHE